MERTSEGNSVPPSSSVKDGKMYSVRKIMEKSKEGFQLKYIAQITSWLKDCADNAVDHPDDENAATVCDLLQISRLPFLMDKVSDEINYAAVVTDFLVHIGDLMMVPIPNIRQQTCASIISIYSDDKVRRYEADVRPTSLIYRQKQVERSGLAETVVMSLRLMENTLSIKLQILQTLQILSNTSKENCIYMLKADAAKVICLYMNQPDPSGQLLFLSTEILWNMLDNSRQEDVTTQLCSMECITVLKDAFFHLLDGYKRYDQQLRNDLLVITTLIAENPNALLVESGFAEQLIVFATVPELQSNNPLIINFKPAFTSEDFEMKKLLLNLLVVLSRDVSAVQLFKECQILPALMLLVRPSTSEGRPSGRGKCSWTSSQQEELQLQALATLATLAPLMVDEYVSCDVNTCLLTLLTWCTHSDGYYAQGNSFHGTGGRGGKKAHIRYCVRILRCMASLNDSLINQDLCDQGVIKQLFGLLRQVWKDENEDDAVYLEIETDILIALSALCKGGVQRKELFGSEGVKAAVRYLKQNIIRLYSGQVQKSLFLATVECVWSCIVGCSTIEDLFFAKNGAFLLLDLLHASPKKLQDVVLGVLLELSDNPKTLDHLKSWRAEKEFNAPSLLLQLWRQEETELGVQRDLCGRIADVKKPLMSERQDKQPIVSIPADQPSPAVMDVSENLRAKIYSMFCKLGFEDLPDLDNGDYITLSIVQMYLDFKIGEVWGDISAELEMEGVRPITPDAETLSSSIQSSEHTAKHVYLLQQSILDRQELEDMQQEEFTYRDVVKKTVTSP